MKIESQKKVSKVVHRVLEYYPLFEEAMQGCNEYDKKSDQDFLIEYVDDTSDDLKELKENIENIEVSKKKDLVTMKLEKFKKKHLVKKETFSPKNWSCSCTQKRFIFVKLKKWKVSDYQEILLKIYLS